MPASRHSAATSTEALKDWPSLEPVFLAVVVVVVPPVAVVVVPPEEGVEGPPATHACRLPSFPQVSSCASNAVAILLPNFARDAKMPLPDKSHLFLLFHSQDWSEVQSALEVALPHVLATWAAERIHWHVVPSGLVAQLVKTVAVKAAVLSPLKEHVGGEALWSQAHWSDAQWLSQAAWAV